jgi:hypothetical protein
LGVFGRHFDGAVQADIDVSAREGNVYNPKPSAEKHASKKSTTATGLAIEDQVRKEWDPRKGGLPTF